ncbi:MAG: TonB-dependent receptor [Bacteroidetes bacterium]|nr:TonB-dependent receptor [Bacteroidota bacterium]
MALLFYSMPTYAGGKPFERVSGTITDSTGKPLEGVNVMVKGGRKGVSTNARGEFVIEANAGSTLIVSGAGFLEQQIKVTGEVMTISLRENARMLEEVYVGYTRLRKADVTGAMASVKASEMNLSTPTIGQALVGKVAGVQVSQVSGAPYGGVKIRVRGTGSINASSEPLYVIDGYPVGGNIMQGPGNSTNGTGGYNPSQNGNDLFINPEDIESIEILKDAASAAIYGSRASGGVVLITTKRGRSGKGTLTYDLQVSRQQLAHKVKLLNASQFADLFVDGRNNNYKDILLANGTGWNDSYLSDDNATRVKKAGQTATSCSVCIISDLYDFPTHTLKTPKYNTDWQDVLYSNVTTQRHNLSFSGGSQNTRYLISGGYLDQPGILNSTYQKRINLRANIDADVTPRLKVSSSVFVTNTVNREVEEGRFDHGPILGALVYMPIFPAFNPDGSVQTADQGASKQWDGYTYAFQGIENPLALAQRNKITRNGTRAMYQASASYQIIKDLVFKASLGGETYQEKYEYYFPTNLSNGINPPGSPQSILAANAAAQSLTTQDKLAEFTLNYKKEFGRHRFDLLGGYTAQETKTDVLAVAAKDFTSDNVPDITAVGSTAGDFTQQSNTGKTTTTLLSYLGRVVYSYNNRYFLTGSFRSDASSRFGPANKWGQFGSVAAGWTLSNESFYHDWLGQNSLLKLRASWGLTGNNNIGNYQYEQDITGAGGVVIGNNVYNSNWAAGLKDPALGWESTSQLNFGLDASTWHNRLSFNVNYYISRSYNLLLNRPITATGNTDNNTTILTNLHDANIHNQGIDLQVDVKVVQSKDFNLGFTGNITHNANKVVSLGGASEIQVAGAERQYTTHVTRVGAPIGSFYGVKVAGMVREKDLAAVASDLAVYKANKNSFPTGYKLQAFPISSYSSTPLEAGDLYFKDKNGDGVINESDKDVIGSPYPDFTYGFAITANYKMVDLSASFNGSHGNKIIDGQDYYIRNMEGSGNNYVQVDQRYRSEARPGNGHEYRASRGGDQSNSTRLSDFYLQDGSFFRCTNMTLGVNLNQIVDLKKAGLSGLRFYVSVDNAFTVTKYLGYNPEVDYNNGANTTPGVDYGKYPLMRSFNTGIKVVF